MIWDKMNTQKIRIKNYIISINFVTSKTKYWRTSLERYDLFRYYNMRFHTTLSLKIKTTIGDAWIRQNWFFLGKIPNSLWSPPPSPPSFRNFSLLFFCKYALIYVNLQWHFWIGNVPPPFRHFLKENQIYDTNLRPKYLFRIPNICNASFVIQNYPPLPFRLFPKKHQFWRIQAYLRGAHNKYGIISKKFQKISNASRKS